MSDDLARDNVKEALAEIDATIARLRAACDIIDDRFARSIVAANVDRCRALRLELTAVAGMFDAAPADSPRRRTA